MVGSSNTLRKIGGKLAVNTCYVLNEYKLLHALSIVKIKQLEAVLFTF